MKRAALLIDWENFASRLAEDPYWVIEPAPLVRSLIEAIEKRATNEEQAELIEKTAFFSVDKDIGAPTRKALVNAGFTLIPATNAKNGADTRLIVYATRFREVKKFDVFYVITGDEDFADLAIELENSGAACFLCPIDNTRLRGPIKDWEPKIFVDGGFIKIQRGAPPTASELDQFIVCVQAINDAGNHIGDWNATVRMVADKFGLGGVDGVAMLMNRAKEELLIWEGAVEIDGASRRRRRLQYENQKLMRLLRAADSMLEEITWKHGYARHGELLSALPNDAKTEYAALPEMLVAAGYLQRVGETFGLNSRAATYGILRPLRRIALTVWHQALQNPQRPVAPPKVHQRWVRHAFPGQARDLPAEKYDRALDDGRAMVKRALATGILFEKGGGENGPYGYVVNDDHPIVIEAKAVAKAVWDALPQNFSTIGQIDLLESLVSATTSVPALGSTERDHRFWLGALASEQVIHLYKGRVQRGKNTELRNRW